MAQLADLSQVVQWVQLQLLDKLLWKVPLIVSEKKSNSKDNRSTKNPNEYDNYSSILHLEGTLVINLRNESIPHFLLQLVMGIVHNCWYMKWRKNSQCVLQLNCVQKYSIGLPLEFCHYLRS